MILCGLFIALGVIVPILFHMVGLGSFMLPMFWPLCLGAFMLSPAFAILIGILTPLISMLLTGMPPAPVSYLMAPELAVACGLISMLKYKFNWGSFWILIIGLFCSRIVLFMLTVIFAPLIGLPGRFAGWARTLNGLPGLITMLVIIPLFLLRMNSMPIFNSRKP